MAKEPTKASFGRPVLGLGVMAMAVVALVWGGFDAGQPVPKSVPGRAVLATVVAGFMLIAGAATAWRRTAAWGAGALAAYYTLIVVILLDGPDVVAHPAVFGVYSNTAEQLAIAAGALVVYAANARIDAALAGRLTKLGRLTFGICAILFGVAHFAYMNLTAPFVPKWLPPSQVFWGYATGVAHIAAGVAIITGVQARRAAIALTVMYVLFGVLVHAPLALAHPSDHGVWSENALNLALIGVAWVVADSLAVRPKPISRRR